LSYFSLQFQREFTARSSKLKRDHGDASEKKRERFPRVPNRFSEGKKKKNEIHGFRTIQEEEGSMTTV